jgi:hypothetical protein
MVAVCVAAQQIVFWSGGSLKQFYSVVSNTSLTINAM